MLRHDAERCHIAEHTHIRRSKRERNTLSVVRYDIASISGGSYFPVFICLLNKICASVGVLIIEREENVFCSDRLTIRPLHAVYNCECPCNCIVSRIICKQWVIITDIILPNEGRFRYSACKHIKGIFVPCGCLYCGGGAYNDLVDRKCAFGGSLGLFCCRGIGRRCSWLLCRTAGYK